ncbi:MAG: hypothetical protein U0795_06445 [Pirellulales bacterium]
MWLRQRSVITWTLATALAATALLGDGLHLLLDPSHLLHWAVCSDHHQSDSACSVPSSARSVCLSGFSCCHRTEPAESVSGERIGLSVKRTAGEHNPERCGICRLLAMSQHLARQGGAIWATSPVYAAVFVERAAILPDQRSPHPARAPPAAI